MLVWCLALALAGCGATTTAGAGALATAKAQAAATSTVTAQATASAQPVTLVATLAQRGTVATREVQLLATVTIANHTNATIHLGNSVCIVDDAHTTGGRPDGRPATIGVQVDDASTQDPIWYSWDYIMCIKGAAFLDVQEVPAGGTFTATLTCDLTSGPLVVGEAPRVGRPYRVHVIVFNWHQGTVDQYLKASEHSEQPGALWDNNLAVELPFTFG